MKHIFLFLCMMIGFFGEAMPAFGQQEFDPGEAHYLWPTEASSYLTSTFAETRSAHFHAALDIKTWGQRGYEVYATRDGVVDRVAIGPKGYGKVVYLKHNDGSYSVYAHLLSFNSELQQLADSIRFSENYRFEFERFWGWKNIEVKQGDVIGYSGASGIGPPHLHFELRTPTHKPFNPLLTNLSVKDNVAPRISGIAIEPLSPESSIEGENKIFTKRAWGQKEHYNLGTVEINGPIGLGINAFDKSNRVHNSYAVYELSMSVNGRELFTSKVDSFSYHETDQMFIDRVYPILQKSGKGYQRLYIADGNSLPFYTTDESKGILDLEPGIHDVRIRATDFFGNSTTASLTLNVSEKDIPLADLSKDLSSSKKSIPPSHQWNWFRDWLTLDQSQWQRVTIGSTDAGKFIPHDNGLAINLKELNNLFLNTPDLGPLMMRRVMPNSTTYVSSEDLQNFTIFPPQAFYDTVSVGMSVRNHKPDSISVDLLPEAYPTQKDFQFYAGRSPDLTDTDRLSFYYLDRDDHEWDLAPTVFKEDYIVVEAESLGSFVMLRDTTAPKLYDPRVVKRPDGQWLVMIKVLDNLSGIDHNATQISVNGVRGIAEYEPEDNRFVYYHPEFVPSPTLNIEVTAFDKIGNKRSAVFHIEDHPAKK